MEDVELLKAEIRRVIRSSMGTRAKESLIIEYINNTDLSSLKGTDDILESFYSFAKGRKVACIHSMVRDEKLKEGAELFIERSISKGYVDYTGDTLDKLLPATSRRGGARERKKESILEKIRSIVEVFVGI